MRLIPAKILTVIQFIFCHQKRLIYRFAPTFVAIAFKPATYVLQNKKSLSAFWRRGARADLLSVNPLTPKVKMKITSPPALEVLFIFPHLQACGLGASK